MSKLAPALRQLLADLVDKRLWPVALALVIALVAIPLVLGGSASDSAAPGAVGATEPDPAAASSASPAPGATVKKTTASVRKEDGGPIDDPFFDPPKHPAEPQSVAAAGGSTRAVAEKTTSATPKQATAAKPRPSKSRSTPAATPPKSPPPAAVATYLRTVVRLNPAAGHSANAIARLTPLGGAADPAALFFGVTKADSRARYAVFVLGPHATSRGDAICKGGTGCRMFGLKAGDAQIVTLRRPGDGRRLRFTLRVESIRAISADAARAATRRAHVHPDGRRALRVMRADAATAAALRAAEYDTQAGLLVSSDAGAVQDASG